MHICMYMWYETKLSIFICFQKNKQHFLNMINLKRKYNLENPSHVQELIDFIENDEILDMGEIGIGVDNDEEDEIVSWEMTKRIREGAEIIPRNCTIEAEDVQEVEEDSDAQNVQIIDNNDETGEQIPDITAKKTKKEKRLVEWIKGTFQTINRKWLEDTLGGTSEQLYPIEYFLQFVPDDMFEDIAMYTNMYAIQNEIKFKPTTKSEIQTLFALHILIGTFNKFPRIRMFWEHSLGLRIFLDNMSRDRFFQLRTCLHFVDNLNVQQQNNDKLVKVRPLINSVKNRCHQLKLEQNLCVDEQMIPFTGAVNFKQYVKGKPCPWGIKVFVLCGKSGQAYDFLFYQGKTTPLDKSNVDTFGQAASFVLHLTQRIQNSGHKLFYDNYFSSYSLLTHLREKGILAAGTVRINRFYKPPLMTDTHMNKKDRGSSEEMVSKDGVVILKWLDNKTICLASNYVGKGVEDKAKRWDKVEQKYIMIDRPQIVQEYNHSMGGVDLLDQLISTYRIFIRSRKWTLRVAMHLIDFALANSWIEYKTDCERNNVPAKQILPLLEFRTHVAESLIKWGKNVRINKRGRPSSSPSPREFPIPRRKPTEVRPLQEIQKDHVDHLPHFDTKKEATRCKLTGCKGRSHIFCNKCQVHLCLVRNRNCFVDFHQF